MARSLENKANVEDPDSDYPYGRIRDKTPLIGGTPLNEQVYGDMHQFFAKMFAESGLVYNELPDNDYAGFQFFEALIKIINLNSSAGVIETGSGAHVIKKKVIETGAWNMDSTGQIDIPHGLTPSKILRITVMIRSDNGDWDLTPLEASNAISGAGGYSTLFGLLGVDVRIVRNAGGIFDSPSYSNTGYNRGYIMIDYRV
jgi:hypothetical protein